MNVSYEWLRSFVPFPHTPEQLRDLITARAATVEELASMRPDLAPIVVARVVEEGPHPDSDRLHVTRVDDGSGELLEVVCGAPNVTAGKLYPFARTGTVMPNGLRIERRKIRGAVSNGMLCSERELGLGEDQAGIMELAGELTPGMPFLAAFPAGDTRLVVDVLPNRPDLLSHLGVAREVSAAVRMPLALPDIPGLAAHSVAAPVEGTSEGTAGHVRVRIHEASLVRRFMGVVIRGVKVGPSPEWLVQRLESVGGRSINNVVDASNYVLHELGQPTHAFDLRKLAGSAINVRLAQASETIRTLDGVERALHPDVIVIADADAPQAVAGVMGGADSEVTDDTTDIFLEVANFDPARVRAGRRMLGLSTDASYRFERGVDVAIATVALERVARLIMLLAGGSVEGTPVDIMPRPAEPRIVRLRPDRVRRVLGDVVPANEITALLSSIGLEVEQGNGPALAVTIPSWRGDIEGEIDLIEEVARLRGYDTFPDEIRPFRPGTVPDDPQWILARRVREALIGSGLFEAKPLPFVAGGDGHVRVANPLSEAEAHLRRGILESLAPRAEANLAHRAGDIRLFEIGSVFAPRDGAMPREDLEVGVLVMGRRFPRHFTDPKSDELEDWAAYDAWDARGIAELLARTAFPSQTRIVSAGTDGSLWDILVDGRRVGRVVQVVLDAPVWARPAFGVELTLGPISAEPVAPRGAHAHGTTSPRSVDRRAAPIAPLPATPSTEFDLALLLPEGLEAARVEDVIHAAAGELLERLELFDVYTGPGVGKGLRSVAWRLTLRHAERTLRDKEIEGRRSKILNALAQELNVRPRAT